MGDFFVTIFIENLYDKFEKSYTKFLQRKISYQSWIDNNNEVKTRTNRLIAKYRVTGIINTFMFL